MSIQAIETVYRGYRFRSRTEARWAVFFDALGIRWEYEHEGYQFSDGTRYSPDFWLPDWGVVVEVKGAFELSPSDRKKVESMAYLSGDGRGTPVIVAFGAPVDRTVLFAREFTNAGCGDLELPCVLSWRAPWIFALAPSGVGDESLDASEAHGFNFSGLISYGSQAQLEGQQTVTADLCATAINAARGARFEFGESGAGR